MSDVIAGYDYKSFQQESNLIESIREVLPDETEALTEFCAKPVTVATIKNYVVVVQPDARLRDIAYLNVRVGDYIAPAGGPRIAAELRQFCKSVNKRTPHANHVIYENLHPFTDGNGRSGRAIWLHQMLRPTHNRLLRYGFLHAFYYQTLAESRRS